MPFSGSRTNETVVNNCRAVVPAAFDLRRPQRLGLDAIAVRTEPDLAGNFLDEIHDVTVDNRRRVLEPGDARCQLLTITDPDDIAGVRRNDNVSAANVGQGRTTPFRACRRPPLDLTTATVETHDAENMHNKRVARQDR